MPLRHQQTLWHLQLLLPKAAGVRRKRRKRKEGGREVPLEPSHAQVAVVAAPEALGKGVVLNFQLGYLGKNKTKNKVFESKSEQKCSSSRAELVGL